MNGIGEAAGVPASTISRLVKGGRSTDATVKAVSSALRVSEHQVLTAAVGESRGPWEPPLESHLLTSQEREALGVITRGLVEKRGGPDAGIAEAEKKRARRRAVFVAGIDETSPEDLQEIARDLDRLDHEAGSEGMGWKPEDEQAYDALCRMIDALAWAEDNDLVVVERISYPDHDYSHGWPQGDYLGLGNWEPHPRGIVELPVAGFDAPDDADVVIDFVQRRLLREMNEVQAVALDSPTSDANRAEAELDAQCGEVVDFPGPPPADDDDQAEPPGWAKKLSAREVADEPKGTGEHH